MGTDAFIERRGGSSMYRWITSSALALLIVAGTLLGASGATAQVPRGDVAALLVLLHATWSALAQTPPSGTFEGLLPADQKIARALFEAQKANAPERLGLDQIAAPKRSGEGWGEVFRAMKAHGLVADKTLGQVVSRFNETHRDGGGRSK
jgi:hypothetical protein